IGEVDSSIGPDNYVVRTVEPLTFVFVSQDLIATASGCCRMLDTSVALCCSVGQQVAKLGVRHQKTKSCCGDHSRGGERERLLVYHGLYCVEQCASRSLYTRRDQK